MRHVLAVRLARTGVLTALLAFLAASPSFSQRDMGISPQMLQELRSSCPADAHFKATLNALSQTDGSKLATNWQNVSGVDSYFSIRLKDQKITDQKSSGRCWMFSALNILRPLATKRLHTDDLEFSQNYLFFYDKLEKANLFLEAIIKNRALPVTDHYMEFLLKQPVQDGGNWLGFIELVKKYGVVPKDVIPETFSSSNSGTVNRVLALRLKQYALKLRTAGTDGERVDLKTQALKDVYKILAMNFGIPPESFRWRYQTENKKLSEARSYTPLDFYKEFVKESLDDYYALYSIPTLPFGKRYEIDLDKAVYDRPNMNFVNVPVAMLKQLAVQSLKDSLPVWFGCDVGQELVGEKGLMLPEAYDYASVYGMDFSLTRKELFETYSSSPGHNMVFTGVDLVNGAPTKWLVENSWGEKAGTRGYFTMLDEWFDRYVQVIVVPKKYIPAATLSAFTTQALVLPPWDPMFKALTIE